MESDKALVRREAEELWNGNELDLVDELYADTFVGHLDSSTVRGRRALKAAMAEIIEALPDIRMTIFDLISEGDTVATRWSATGIHKGEFRGVRPTGRSVTITGITLWRVVGGRFAEAWTQRDLTGLTGQEARGR